MIPAPALLIPGLDPARSVAIVGNAPEIGDHAAAIDAADLVIRFNNAPGFLGRTGRRVTHLALVNRGGQMRAWLDDPAFLDQPAIRATGAFVLPFPALADEGPERVCWTPEALALLRPLARPIGILPESLHAHGRDLLGPHTRERPNPSTGFLVALAVMQGRPAQAAAVDVYGFGFAGWPGHPWAAERLWFEAARAGGRLRLHAVASGKD